MKSKYLLTLVSMLILFTGGVSYAQVKNKKEAGFTGLERWAFKTNALGWVLTVPNFTAEVDLSSTAYNRSTFSLTAKYNWNTTQTLLPYYVFNFAQLRPEYRYYFRTENSKFLEKRIKKPKTKRANYFGIFADAGSYTFKVSEYGYQGWMCGGGLSFGYGVPMYEYKRGAIDVELGFALGVMLATSEVFVLNETDPSNYRYDVIPEKSKPLHVIPCPVISELSVTFAWRKASIKQKYSKINQAKRQAKLARQDSIYMAKQAKEEAKLQAAKEKERKKQEKLEKKNNKGKKDEAALSEKKGREKPLKEEKTKEKKEKKTKDKDARKK